MVGAALSVTSLTQRGQDPLALIFLLSVCSWPSPFLNDELGPKHDLFEIADQDVESQCPVSRERQIHVADSCSLCRDTQSAADRFNAGLWMCQIDGYFQRRQDTAAWPGNMRLHLVAAQVRRVDLDDRRAFSGRNDRGVSVGSFLLFHSVRFMLVMMGFQGALLDKERSWGWCQSKACLCQ
jgi:hypothetical protein